jgi:CheY-like chemotaxis protein
MSDSIDVLLVDEDEEVLDLTETFLSKKSDRIDVGTETDPPRAIERTAGDEFDCVVSDYRMPGMNGVELCAEIRSHADVPFFLFTAASRDEIDDDRLGEAVTGYIQKGAGTTHYDELVDGIEGAFE